MKRRAVPWNAEKDDSSSDGSSSVDADSESDNGTGYKNLKNSSNSCRPSKETTSEDTVKPRKRKSGAIGFDALTRHGYIGGLSVLSIPAPKEGDKNQDWSWSTGRERRSEASKEIKEPYEDQQETPAAAAVGEETPAEVRARKEKVASFSQKEKRKRDIGQASRGKNYVEEEKRMLRDSGIYSGFDS